MKTKHTKGPWKHEGYYISDENGKIITTPQNKTREDFANSQLITAAPDSNAANKAFIAGWGHFLDCINFGSSALDAKAIQFMNEIPGQIQAAIAKAEGE